MTATAGNPSTSLRISQARPETLGALIEVLEEAATWLWDRGIHQWEPGSMRAQRSALFLWARSGQMVIATQQEEVAGDCFLVDEPGPEWNGHRGLAVYLHKLVVARSHSGSGVSGRLLDWCHHRALELGRPRVRLDCWDGNTRLRAFYRAAGYRELEAVPSLGYRVRLFERRLGRAPGLGTT